MSDKNIKTIADRLQVFTSTDNRPFVNIPCPANTRAYQSVPLRSAAFRTWFHGEYAAECDGIPANRAFHSVLHHLEGRAFRHSDSTRIVVGRRVSARTDSYATSSLLIDLASPSGEIVEITPDGWSVKNDPNAPFEPSPLAIPIPTPIEDRKAPALETLRGCLNLDRTGWLLCLAWILAALRPDGPYPVLILQGPSGSGKSLMARLLRTLVEPSTAPLAATPRSVRDLIGIARRHWVVALDHISNLGSRVADALCCLTSGLGIVAHEDVRSRGAAPFEQNLKRPVILTVTERFTCPPDLARRALVVNCPPIPSETCRTEADILQTFSDAFPAIFGALCSVLAVALRNSAELLRPASGSHCPDALAWAIAAAPALGCTPDEMKQAFDPGAQPVPDPPVTAEVPCGEDPGGVPLLPARDMPGEPPSQVIRQEIAAEGQLHLHYSGPAGDRANGVGNAPASSCGARKTSAMTRRGWSSCSMTSARFTVSNSGRPRNPVPFREPIVEILPQGRASSITSRPSSVSPAPAPRFVILRRLMEG